MNKSKFVERLATSLGGTKAEASRVLETFQMTVLDALKNGEDVILTGFGTWTTVDRAARSGINPQNGKKIEIDARRLPKFKPGKSLKEAVSA